MDAATPAPATPAAGEEKAPVAAPAVTGAPPAAEPVAKTEPEKKPERESKIAAKIEEIRKRELKLAERDAEFATTKKERDDAKKEIDALRGMKGDPRALLKWGGFSNATDFARAMVRNPEAAHALTELEKYKKEQADKETKAQQAQSERQEQENRAKATGRIKGEIEKLGDDAEFAKAHGDAAVNDVIAVCERYYEQHGVVPDLAKAIKQVDAYYESQLKAGLATKRGKALATPPSVDPKAAKVEPKIDPTRTLVDRAGLPPDPQHARRRSEKAELLEQLTASYNRKGGAA